MPTSVLKPVLRWGFVVSLACALQPVYSAQLEVSAFGFGNFVSTNVAGALPLFDTATQAAVSGINRIDVSGAYRNELTGTTPNPRPHEIRFPYMNLYAGYETSGRWTDQTLSIRDDASFQTEWAGDLELNPRASVSTNLTFLITVVGDAGELVGTPVRLNWDLAVASYTLKSLPPEVVASSGGNLFIKNDQNIDLLALNLDRGVGNSADGFLAKVGDVLELSWATSGGYQTGSVISETAMNGFTTLEHRHFNLSVSPVPEPSSLALGLVGIGLALRARRKP